MYSYKQQLQLLGERLPNTEANSFAWSQHEQKLFAVRPVKARVSWFTSDNDIITVGTNLVANTNRIVTVEQGWPVCSIGSEIAAIVVDQAFDYLDAPPARITGKDVPMPYAANQIGRAHV